LFTARYVIVACPRHALATFSGAHVSSDQGATSAEPR